MNMGMNALYRYSTYSSYGAGPSQAWPIAIAICLIIGIVGALVLFFTFLSARNDGKYTGFVGWLYEFLNFRKLLLEAVLRIIYIAFAIFLTLVGFLYIFIGFNDFGQNFLGGLGIIVIGNVLLRISYEFIMLTVSICKNVSDINRKMGGGNLPNKPLPPMNPFNNVPNANRPQPPVNPQAPVQNFMPQQPRVNPQAPVQNPMPQQAPVRPAAPAQNAPVQNPTVPLRPAQPPVAPQSQDSNATVSLPHAQQPVPPQNPTMPLTGAQNGGPAPSSPMVFCRNCGKQFSADSAACPHCGTPRRK